MNIEYLYIQMIQDHSSVYLFDPSSGYLTLGYKEELSERFDKLKGNERLEPTVSRTEFVCCFRKQLNGPGDSLFDFSGYAHTGSQDDQNAKTYHQYSKTNGISDNLCHVNIYKGNCTNLAMARKGMMRTTS